MPGPLGRREPTDFTHVDKYPYAAVAPSTVATVNKVLPLPTWHWTHDQGVEGSCVGHGIVMERAIANTAQNRIARAVRPGRRYDPIDLWRHAKVVDEWPETTFSDGGGTSVRAGYDVARDRGLSRVQSMVVNGPTTIPIKPQPVNPAHGVSSNRWATTVDEVRTALSQGVACAIGVSWYTNFDNPEKRSDGYHWIGRGDLGTIRGGHCLTIYGASDQRQAFRLKNSWGKNYPLVWITYSAVQRLLIEGGEFALVTDR